jgi:hypothetical protein
MVPLFVYGFFMMMYVPAFAFSAVYSTWFFSPYVGYIDEEQLEVKKKKTESQLFL